MMPVVMTIMVMARVVLVPAVMMAAMPAVMTARAMTIDGMVPVTPVPAMGLRLRLGAGAETGEGETDGKRQQQQQLSHELSFLGEGRHRRNAWSAAEFRQFVSGIGSMATCARP